MSDQVEIRLPDSGKLDVPVVVGTEDEQAIDIAQAARQDRAT